VGNQADSETLTTGRNKPSPFLSHFLSSFCLAWFIARCCFSSTQLIPLDSHQYNQLRLITLVLPYHHFESTLPFSTWSLYHYNFTHRNQLRYADSKHIFSLYRLKTLLILLACDVARNPGPITINCT
jgi:hypothetical protein